MIEINYHKQNCWQLPFNMKTKDNHKRGLPILHSHCKTVWNHRQSSWLHAISCGSNKLLRQFARQSNKSWCIWVLKWKNLDFGDYWQIQCWMVEISYFLPFVYKRKGEENFCLFDKRWLSKTLLICWATLQDWRLKDKQVQKMSKIWSKQSNLNDIEYTHTQPPKWTLFW